MSQWLVRKLPYWLACPGLITIKIKGAGRLEPWRQQASPRWPQTVAVEVKTFLHLFLELHHFCPRQLTLHESRSGHVTVRVDRITRIKVSVVGENCRRRNIRMLPVQATVIGNMSNFIQNILYDQFKMVWIWMNVLYIINLIYIYYSNWGQIKENLEIDTVSSFSVYFLSWLMCTKLL